MAIRPDRKDPISTRPVYLPVVPTKELNELAPKLPKAEPAEVTLFTDLVGAGTVDLEALAAAVAEGEGVRGVHAGGDFFARLLQPLAGTTRRDAVATTAHALAWARVRSPANKDYRMVPTRGEIDYETGRLHGRLHPEFGNGGLDGGRYNALVQYDGAAVQQAYSDLLEKSRTRSGTAIIVTDRRLVSWDDKGGWDAVPSVGGNPFVVCLPGDDLPQRVLADAIRVRLGRKP